MSNEKDMSPVLTENKFTEFYNNHIYPYLNGATHDGCVPVGSVISYFGETAPRHYLICDGTAYNKTDYPELWTLLSSLTDTTPYVVSGDNTKFKVPDLRGEFLRGTGTNSHTNQGSGANVGVHRDATAVPSEQATPSNNSINVCYPHRANPAYDMIILNPDGYAATDSDYYQKSISVTRNQNLSSGSYVRPTNTSVLFCIAYESYFIDATIDGKPIDISNLQDGDTLIWDATNQEFKNGTSLHEYSTTEKVVGKWIDGRPVYEKIINLSNSDFSVSGNIKMYDFAQNSGIDLDNLINISGLCQVTNYGNINFGSPLYLSNSNVSRLEFVQYYGAIALLKFGSSNAIESVSSDNIAFAKLTCRYTKTTDTV